MKIPEILKDYFLFNRKEQRGLFVLISILTGLIVADIFISDVLPQKQVDFTDFEREVIAFEKEIRLRDSLGKEENRRKAAEGYFSHPGDKPDSAAARQNEEDGMIIDLNTADTFDLQRLRGIGPSFACRIVKYRDRLGGYSEKSQLLEVFGMDAGRYGMVRDHVKANPGSIRKINLNSITFKELLRHPYFPFEVTKSIMLYRKEHKRFCEIEELLKVENMNDSLFRKIRPYVRTE